METGQEPPRGIKTISWLGETVSIIYLLFGVFLLLLSNSNAFVLTPTGGQLFLAAVISVIIGGLGLVAYHLLKKLKKTGWILVIATGAIGLVTRLIFFNNIADVLSAVFWIAIIIYLWKERNLFA